MAYKAFRPLHILGKNRVFAAFNISLIALIFGCAGCEKETPVKKLPIMGKRQVVEKEVNGILTKDTLYHTIAPFRFINQDSQWVDQRHFEGKVYIADFFFTTCPTICPIMKGQMMRVYQAWLNHPEVAFISHTIDPERDSVPVLKKYAQTLGADGKQWHLVTGERSAIYETGLQQYLITVKEDRNEIGDILHSSAFILVDQQRRIRGVYDGTSKEKVDQLIADIGLLVTKNAVN